MGNKISYTKYQNEVFRFIHLEKGNALIEAVAGSGKTTTIVSAIDKIKNRSRLKIIFLAFNNHIAKELAGKLPKSVTATTTHKLGLNWIVRQRQGEIPKIEEYGTSARKMIRALVESEDWLGLKESRLSDQEQKVRISEYTKILIELVSLCKLDLSLAVDQIETTAINHGFNDLSNADFYNVEKILAHIIKNPSLDTISLDDMIFLPAIGVVDSVVYDYVFVDECQDLNRAQQAFIDKMLGPKSRLIAVGDPKQAIYGFAGADNSSFDRIRNRPNTTRFPLSESFRCGKQIVRIAQTISPEISYREHATEGMVRYGSYREIQNSDLVLCRLNAPLVGMCLNFVKNGKNASIIGSDIGKNLNGLIESTAAQSKNDLMLMLASKLIALRTTLSKQGLSDKEINTNNRYKRLDEQILTVGVIAESCNTLREITSKITSIFSDSRDGIFLSSIHRAKGLEADRVFILGDSLMPHSNATLPWELEQEYNLIYVAYTRAKKELIFINDYEESYSTTNWDFQRSSRLDEFLGLISSS